jgi:deoxyribodipyrimidine photolyase
LRLIDNTALHAAVSEADGVIPVFIFDVHLLGAPEVSVCQVEFMLTLFKKI